MSNVVIYDSGVGGLSVYHAIRELCPSHNYVFLSDNQAFPYGLKPEDELLRRVSNVVDRAVHALSPDILVVACNTASTVALPSLRARYTIPFVGVVPAIKPAALVSKTKHIALLATPATIDRAYTQSLIDEFASDCAVLKIGSSELVELAEQRLRSEPVAMERLTDILHPILQSDAIDTVVLACTHFPLLAVEIQAVFKQHNRSIALVDSGAAIARRVSVLAPSESSDNGTARAVFTRELGSSSLANNLRQMGFSDFSVLAIPA